MVTKSPKVQKCECGKIVANGSVFCMECKELIEQKNIKVIDKENAVFNKRILSS